MINVDQLPQSITAGMPVLPFKTVKLLLPPGSRVKDIVVLRKKIKQIKVSDIKIAAKIIKGSEVIEGVEYYLLESTYVNDKIMKDSKSNMVYWYDNYFIAYGFQIIKNNSLMRNSKRNVFYINKVAFQ